ncbi:MAG: hypothetical protein QOI04_2200 [Verrucomicrobiota bacterium]|jgi:hypothetical protein
MNSALPTAGSPIWQIVFVSFAAVLILFEIVRGWRLGLPRQLMRVAAVAAAYAIAIFGGRFILPVARPFVKMPDIAISIFGAALLGLLVYFVITIAGAILFKRTNQQSSSVVRWFYGLTGALLGLFFGAFFVWLVVVGVRSLGAIADAKVRTEAAVAPEQSQSDTSRRIRLRLADVDLANAESGPLLEMLARLKNSIELGAVGDVVKTSDVVPASTYQTLGKIGLIFSNPESAARFLSYPGARELSDHPKIVALRSDPEITEMISQGRYFDLLHDARVIDAANDPTLAERVTKFDLQRALDYAATKDSR